MMDRDYPPTPRQKQATVVALVAAAIVGILLFAGDLPGLHPQYSGFSTTSYDGRTYYWTNVPLPFEYMGDAKTPPQMTVFHNVTFWTWLTNWTLLGNGYLHGNASGSNGTLYTFVLGGPPSAANRTNVYAAPGGAVVVEWTVDTSFTLLVPT